MMCGNQSRSKMLPLVLFSVFILLSACASGGGARKAETQPQAEQPAQPANQPEAVDPPLAGKYNSIIVFDFEMNLDVSFIDAGSNREVRKKEMNSATNAWAAAWTSGSSDRSLPADMGRIIADYVMAVVPRQ